MRGGVGFNWPEECLKASIEPHLSKRERESLTQTGTSPRRSGILFCECLLHALQRLVHLGSEKKAKYISFNHHDGTLGLDNSRHNTKTNTTTTTTTTKQPPEMQSEHPRMFRLVPFRPSTTLQLLRITGRRVFCPQHCSIAALQHHRKRQLRASLFLADSKETRQKRRDNAGTGVCLLRVMA